ncbi:MAG: ATP-binding protein [Nitrospirota bacterium]
MDKYFKDYQSLSVLQEKGTGLGLSISYRIIQSHGRRINVESKEGKGTRFIITFPVNLKSVS